MMFLVCFGACTGKKDRLTADTSVLTIEPGQIMVGKNTRTTLNAIYHNAGGGVITPDISPAWSVVDSNIGTISPAHGRAVTFISGNLLGTTTIYAQYGSARAIGNVTVSNVTPINGNIVKEFDIFREIPAIPSAVQFPGGYSIYVSHDPQPVVAIVTGILGMDHTEGSQGLRVDIGAHPGGIYFGYSSPTNLTSLSSCYLVFDVKTTPNVDLLFQVGSDAYYYSAYDMISNYVPLDGNWHTVSVKISSLATLPSGGTANFTKVTIPFQIGSAKTGTNTNFTFYVDNVRWQQ